jgi:hypothetical protein
VQKTGSLALFYNPTHEFLPKSIELSQNYPNPFNPTTNFRFSIPKNTNVSLKIYDALGKEVQNYFEGFMDAGTYNVTFDGSKLSSGIYFYKLQTKDFSDIKKMMIIK